jgi:hypothetical protein
MEALPGFEPGMEVLQSHKPASISWIFSFFLNDFADVGGLDGAGWTC